MSPLEIAALAGLPGIVLGWLGNHFTSRFRKNGTGEHGKEMPALQIEVTHLCERLERLEIAVDGIPKAIEESGHDLRDFMGAQMGALELRTVDGSKELAARVFRLENAALRVRGDG